MEPVIVNTTLLGALTVPYNDGLYEEYTAVFGEKKITFNLYIMEQSVTPERMETAAKFVNNLPQMYQKGKEAIAANAESEVVSFFVQDQLENIEEQALLPALPVDSLDEVTTEMFLGLLELRSARIGLNAQNELDCVLDYSLDEEISDELLVLYFNTQLEITYMTHES